MTRIRAFASAGAVALALAFAAPASAQWIVYDPTNYAQNVLQAARALEQIGNQVTSLQNEAQMLINQARQLASLPASVQDQITGTLAQIQGLLHQADRLAYDVQAIEHQFLATDNDESEILAALRSAGQDTVNQAGQQLASREIDIAPTLTIRPGFPLRVMVKRDLVFASYEDPQ